MTPRISFYLKNPKAKKFSVLFSRIIYHGFQLKVYLPFRVNPILWDKKKQILKDKDLKYRDETAFITEQINENLNQYSKKVCKYILEYEKENDKIPPTPEKLKGYIESYLRNREYMTKEKFNLFTYFQKIIKDSEDGTRLHTKSRITSTISAGTIKSYKTTYKRLLEYKNQSPFEIDFETLDKRFYDDFKSHLLKQEYTINYLGKLLKDIKMVCNEARRENIKVNPFVFDKSFIIPKESVENVYLDESELSALARLDLSDNKTYDEVRDLFLVACYTALRYSDFSQIKKENFTADGYIEKKQQKGKSNVVIPIKRELRLILEKYKYQLPKPVSSQKFNQYIKIIASYVPVLNTEITNNNETLPKYNFIASHTGRRSFATNEVHNGTPIIEIMSATGHKTEADFWRYVKLKPRDHARNLQNRYRERESEEGVR